MTKSIQSSITQQQPIRVYYDNIVVGEYIPNLLVNDSIIVELKAVKELDNIHFAQCLNYLNATRLKIALLINFGTPRVQVKRFANDL